MSVPSESWQRNLVGIWVGQTMLMVAFSFVFPFLPLYIQSLGSYTDTEAAQWAGVIGAASALSMCIAQPFWGDLADRYGRKPMVLRSMVGGAIATFLMGLASSPAQLLMVRLAQGLVTGTVAASNALVAGSTPRHRLGFALGMLQMAQFLGSSVGPLIGGFIADTLGFHAAFYSAAALMLMGALVVFLLVHEDFTPVLAGAPRPGIWAESRSLLKIGLFPVLAVVIFMIQLGGTIVTPVLSLFIAELNGGENAATAAGIVLAATGAVSAASALIIGRVSDRLGHAVILPVCLAGAALCYFPQGLVQQVWQLLLLRMLLGVFLGGLMPSANALLAGLVSSQRRGAVFGLAASATALASGVGPLSGAGIATFWDMRAVFFTTGVLFTLAYVWVTIGFRRHEVPKNKAAAGSGEAKL